jgi:chemotaxis protein CheD
MNALPSRAVPDDVQHVFLVPGSMYCSSELSIVSTVLGSCVSLCLWDTLTRVGGMNHFVLPHGPAGEISLRYGDVAIDALWQAMERLGATRRRVRAKVFGGAAVLPFGDDETVGEKNVRLVSEWIGTHGVPVMAAQTGGRRGLQIRFNTGTGAVAVRNLQSQRP